MNLKCSYIIYNKFIEEINKLYNLNLVPKIINLEKKVCILKNLCLGIGDLTWETNLGNQILNDINDTFYYSNDVIDFYNKYKIIDNSNIRIIDYNLNDMTLELENKNEFLHWNIISKYIIYKNQNKNAIKVLIFYDSFLLNIMPLYLDLFENVYFVKSIYNNDIINKISPDYVFEFRCERFLL